MFQNGASGTLIRVTLQKISKTLKITFFLKNEI